MRGAKRLRPGASQVMRTKGPGEAGNEGQGTADAGKKGRGQGARGGWFNPVPSASAPCVIHAAHCRPLHWDGHFLQVDQG